MAFCATRSPAALAMGYFPPSPSPTQAPEHSWPVCAPPPQQTKCLDIASCHQTIQDHGLFLASIHVYPPKMYQSHSGTVPLRRFALAVPLQSSTMLSVVLLLSTLGTLRYPISALTRPLHCNHHTHRSQLAEAPPLLFPNKKVIFAHLQTSTPTPHITHRVGTTLV
eukprot:GGOE01033579.1.p4 GENE.GGOE01033579.1~~GGOE01033579.1.p4  ORF type:complete len:166 (+),score=10.21 GGOE01033579.1:1549-2046(+)